MNVLDIERATVTTVARSGSRIAFADAVPDAVTAGYVGPGWVDVQVNAFAGHDVDAGDLRPEGFEAMTRSLHSEGVTRFLPTAITASPVPMMACLRGVVAARAASTVVGRAMSGIHLEGPLISSAGRRDARVCLREGAAPAARQRRSGARRHAPRRVPRPGCARARAGRAARVRFPTSGG